MVILLCLAFLLGIISTFTDIKDMKVYNKHLLFFLIIGTIIHIINLTLLNYTYSISQIINLIICAIVGYLMYHFSIWGAGDAKLFTAFVYLLPYEIYLAKQDEFFPAFNILAYTFCCSFIYVVIETIMLKIRGKEYIDVFKSKTKFSLKFITNIILSCIFLVNIIFIVDDIFICILGENFESNQSIILMLNILIIIFVLSRNIKFKAKLILSLILSTINTFIIYTGNSILSFNIGFFNFITIILIICIKNEATKYNYEQIYTEDIKVGMILAYQTIALFSASKVKNLPCFTDETPNFRITEAEVEAIKRWEKSKTGKEKIVIVKHLPFAPFIFLGTLLFVIINLYMKFR